MNQDDENVITPANEEEAEATTPTPAPEAETPTPKRKTAKTSEDKSDVRLIRWIGEPARFITRRRRDGTVDRAVDYEFEREREAPSNGHSVRIIDPAHIPGLSRSYHWGPSAPFVAEVKPKDAELILASSSGHVFRDVTDESHVGRMTRKQLNSSGLVRRLEDPLYRER
jgi:hypothetical protein